MGAQESNAGDDFHFWWAASRALALIEPRTESALLVVEGMAPIDDPDDEYQIADVTEYLGGMDLGSATAVLISQLKYSTRHPERPWTAAQLVQKRGRHGGAGSAETKRSVIRDLADTYRRLVADHGRDVVLEKVRIRLVSNQPGDLLLESSITAAADWARTEGATARRGALLKALPDDQAAVILKLSEAIDNRLSAAAFCEFLIVLDLSLSGSLDRTALARSVRAGITKLSPGRGPDSSSRLFNLVRQEALPESRRNGITAADVLAELGVANLLDLYPAPPRLVELPDLLPAPSARAVAQAASAHLGELIVAHGPAGAGKTTAVRQAVDHLPSGSTVLLYDCYGGGEYLSSGEERHTPQRFVMQVVNELAQRCGTLLLLHPPSLEADLWRHLSLTLTQAVDTLTPGAILLLAVDAADNATVAAHERGDRSFLPRLLSIALPSRAVVVLTARSHRIQGLGAVNAPMLGVDPFDAATSAAHLRRHRRSATGTEASEFHDRTGGNPRTQFYVLEKAAANDWDMATLLAASNLTPEPLFADLVDSALKSSGAGATDQRWLALMLALARPVSTGTLAAALDVDTSAVSAFADGLTPGVEVREYAIQFRDEDFEAYVRGRVDPVDVVTAHGRLADLFLSMRIDDPDAAAHVADHLFASDRYEELLELVLGEDSPCGIADGFRRQQVQGRRLDLAVRAISRSNNAADAVRIAARACDTASRMDSLSRLIESRLDLVARYADASLLRTYVLQQSRGGWLGPTQMRLAAALARNPDHAVAAREALESADAWVHRWMAGRKDETRHWSLEAEDLACEAEAYFRLDGVDAAVTSLRRWRPVSFALEAAAALAARIAREVGPEAARAALMEGGVPAVAQAPFLAYSASPEAPPDAGWITAVVTAVVATTADKHEAWHARLIDAVIRHGSKTEANALVSHLARDLPTSSWAFSTPGAEGVSALRSRAVAAAIAGTGLDVDALVPASLRPTKTTNGHPDDPRGRERGDWLRTVRSLGTVALLAARASAGHDVGELVYTEVDRALVGRLEEAGHRWFKYDRSFRTWASLAAEAVADADAPAELLHRITDAAPKLVGQGAPEIWLDLAEVLAVRPPNTDRSADLCARAAAALRDGVYPAPDRLDLLARAADVAGRIAPALGRQIFDHAVNAATGINDDAARMLSVHADLIQRSALAPEERSQVAAQLVRAAEDVAQHVTDPDVVPYQAISGAACFLDIAVGLAAVSRWDDEDRVRLAHTLPTALLAAVNGGGTPALDALVLDHLIEDDVDRLSFQLGLISSMPLDDAGTVTARRATARLWSWLRRHVPAHRQPAMARKLHEAGLDRDLDTRARAELGTILGLAPQRGPKHSSPTSGPSGIVAVPTPVQALIEAPESRNWTTLAEDVALLADSHVNGERLRSFVTAVVDSTPPSHRLEALTAVTDISGWRSADTVLPLLTTFVARWRHWPGVSEWATTNLPALLERHLTTLVAWPEDVGPLCAQLRVLANDDAIRRAILDALPGLRPQLTAQGWQNIAATLGRLCGPADAAKAVVGLLNDRTTGAPALAHPKVLADERRPVVMLLWSALGHPRREMRWRAAHAVRELMINAEPAAAAELTAELIDCLSFVDVGRYRDQKLTFYRLSALSSLLLALARVAADRPALLAPHLQELILAATSRDLPHAQIRELARSAALAVVAHLGAVHDQLRFANRPVGCSVDRGHHYGNNREVSNDHRYRFDTMDTIPYWYAPLARVFGLDVNTIAQRAERWIVDEWRRSEDDWMNDTRELRDEQSYKQKHNDHGAIPPEETLRLYIEYHAMLAAAGELVDDRQSLRLDRSDDAPDPWHDWMQRHLPSDTGIWLSDLRAPVPVEADLFGCLPPLEEWYAAGSDEYDQAFGLVDGDLPETVVVAANISVSRVGAYGVTYVSSALVSTFGAKDLLRALSAASNPWDFKLPDEGDEQFEINHGPFVLEGWLTGADDKRESLDEHDPYGYEMYKTITLPGCQFRDRTGVQLDSTGLALLAPNGATLAQARQWADPRTHDADADATSGYRVQVDRAALLDHLANTGTSLIVEVQIGRHRRDRRSGDEYQTPRSRIYLVDSSGSVTASGPDHRPR